MKTSNSVTRMVAGAASTAALIGGTVLAAPTASAASTPGACTYEWPTPVRDAVSTPVNLRMGPGTSYTSMGILYPGAHFTGYCNDHWEWTWGKVTSGPNKGKSGWVDSSYIYPL